LAGLCVVSPVGYEPNNVTFSPDGKFAWVPDYGDGNVYVISTTTYQVVAKISVGGYANGCIFSPDGKTAYVTSIGTPPSSKGGLFIIDTATYTITKTVTLAVPTGGPAVTPDGKYVYVALYKTTNNPNNGTLVVVNTATYQTVASDPRPSPEQRSDFTQWELHLRSSPGQPNAGAVDANIRRLDLGHKHIHKHARFIHNRRV
jgi:YVTN family beta-propeller protein